MFRYISEILSQISTPQKVIALSLLLLSIVIITISPSLIGAINVDRDELNTEIEKKDKKILQLEKNINSKDSIIRSGQSECTNKIVQREIEFIAMLDDLKRKAKNPENCIKIVKESTLSVDYDTVSTPTTYITKNPNFIIKNDMKKIVDEIDLIKYKVRH